MPGTDRAIDSFDGDVTDDQTLLDFENDVWQRLANGETLGDALNHTEGADMYVPENALQDTTRDTSMTLHGAAFGAPMHQWYLDK